ncbi:MAG: PQQ-binding-like beta-propeller repeat protein [Planctomycetota bacterium]
MYIRPGCFLGVCLALLAWATSLPAEDAVGWRTDGQGGYPSASLPDLSDANAVTWKTKLPDWSNATPCVVKTPAGQTRVFVMTEPNSLICIDGGGKILWQRATTFLDTASDPAGRKKLEEDAIAYRRLEKKLAPIKKELDRLGKEIRKARKDPELKKDANAMHRVVHTLENKRLPLWKKARPIEMERKKLTVFQKPRTHGGTGYTSPTPLSDGQRVWVLLGTGIAACYDMQGKLQWARLVEIPKRGWGHSASPVLADGKLICHVRDLWGLDPSSGKVLWRGEARNAFGTPAVLTVGERTLVVSCGGWAVDASDGTEVAGKLPKLSYNSPVVDGQTVYFVQNGGKAIRFSVDDGGAVQHTELWRTTPKRDRYYASPVLHEGLLYAVTQKGVLSAIDAADGKVVYEQQLDLGRGKVYPSVTLVGGKLLILSEGGGYVVARPGRTFSKLTSGRLSPGRSTPVTGPSGAMYRRGKEYLYCIQ